MQTPEFKEAQRQGHLRQYALHPMSEETKRKISQSNTGKVFTSLHRRHLSEARIGKPSPDKGLPKPSSRYKRSDETKRRMSEGRKRMLKEHPELLINLSRKLTGRYFSPETRQKMSEKRKQYFLEHPEALVEMSIRNKGRSTKSKTRSKTYKQLWSNPEYIRKMISAQNRKPNKAELALEQILDELFPNQFAYNGDFRLGITLDRQIPDFVNVNGKKQVIELFGHYWHQSPGRGATTKIKRYGKLGWKCLIVWDSELKNTDALKDKITAFVGGALGDE